MSGIGGLVHFSSSQSKQFVEQVFVRVYQTRLDGIGNTLLESVSSQLSLDKTKTLELLNSVLFICKQAVFYNLDSTEMVGKLFPNDFNQDIKNLVCEIVAKYVPTWRDQTIQTQVSFFKD